MTDHDDLYGDLGAGDADVENLEYKDKYEALLKEYDQLKDAYAESQAKAQQLEELSSTLERNLCCLYDTAKLEIERKDQIIKDTREQLADARHKAN